MPSVDVVTPTKEENDVSTHRKAPSIAGGYGVMRGHGDCGNRHWRGRCQRGSVGSASPAGPGGLGATPAATGMGTASATLLGAAASSARALYSVPSLLTGSVRREVTADAVDAANDDGVHSVSMRFGEILS
jgi:hypothetical protein